MIQRKIGTHMSTRSHDVFKNKLGEGNFKSSIRCIDSCAPLERHRCVCTRAFQDLVRLASSPRAKARRIRTSHMHSFWDWCSATRADSEGAYIRLLPKHLTHPSISLSVSHSVWCPMPSVARVSVVFGSSRCLPFEPAVVSFRSERRPFRLDL